MLDRGTEVLEATLREAVALHSQGDLVRARALYLKVLEAQPRHFDALHLLGVIAAATGDPHQASVLIAKALEFQPTNAMAHNNRGVALSELGQWDAALASFDRAVALKPDYAEGWYNRGNAFKGVGAWDAAIGSYDRAIVLRSDHAQAHGNRGICLAAVGRWEPALAAYHRALVLDPHYAEAYYNCGNLLCGLRRWDEARVSYDRALRIRPAYGEALANRAFALRELDNLEEALASCDAAVLAQPALATAHINRGTVLVALRRVAEAVTSYDAALAIDPDSASTYVNRGLARLLAGDYQRGWRDYEWRWRDTTGWVFREKRDFPQLRWLGDTSLVGRSILLHAEQGFGDTVQFCRYAKPVADLGARVILEVPRALLGLMQSLEGVSQWVVQGDELPAFDCYCPLLSLPLAMDTSLATIPAAIPYLQPSDLHRRRWQARLGEKRGMRVGLVWSGGHRPARPELWSVDARRNIPLAKFAALNCPGIEFYSLQKGEPAASELAQLQAARWTGPRIVDLGAEIDDFADTAAIIEQLDLVVSVDTATAHVAGALGKPVWVLNRFDACWRWLLDRADSPWYPSARLYRQERPGDWDGALARVRTDLEAMQATR